MPTLPLATAPETGLGPVRFHLSLNVSDLARSVAFYRVLLGLEPAKLRADYAKFEPDQPPLVLSLEPTPRPIGGPLNHLGFRLTSAPALVAMQRRLELAGIPSRREEGVECCYARQTKFWVHDPDRTLWEVYTLDEDIDHRGIGQVPEKVLPAVAGPTVNEPLAWEQRMNEAIPEVAPFASGSVAEVRLRGTFNLELSSAQRQQVLAEVRRVLQPGGRLFVHVLTAERPFSGVPDLPGPAAAVRHVPVDSEILTAIAQAGFHGLRLLKFDAKPCFVRAGVALRETQIEAWRPGAKGGEVTVIYKGPFRAMTDDAGVVFARGQRVRVPAAQAERLRAPEWAGTFLVLD